jgi:hypothetical protein
MGLDKSAYSRILGNIGSIVPCPFIRTGFKLTCSLLSLVAHEITVR